MKNEEVNGVGKHHLRDMNPAQVNEYKKEEDTERNELTDTDR